MEIFIIGILLALFILVITIVISSEHNIQKGRKELAKRHGVNVDDIWWGD